MAPTSMVQEAGSFKAHAGSV